MKWQNEFDKKGNRDCGGVRAVEAGGRSQVTGCRLKIADAEAGEQRIELNLKRLSTHANPVNSQIWAEGHQTIDRAVWRPRLVCVRYRYDAQRKKRYKTVEVIVEEVAWEPKPKRPSADALVEIKVAWGETEIGRQVRRAGGKWNPQKKVWELRYDQAVKLELEKRIVGYMNIDTQKSI